MSGKSIPVFKIFELMLDFYFIQDDQPKHNYSGDAGLKYAGGLQQDAFERLQDKGIIDGRFDYHTDFRWPSILIGQMRQIIARKQMASDTDVIKLVQLFDQADQEQCGLIAYAD